jgi:hypothetical protein
MLDAGPKIMEIIPMNPAKQIIGRLGGEAQVAFITGTAYTAPYRWQAVLDYARSNGIALDAEEFLPPDPRGEERREARLEPCARILRDALL